VFWFIKLINAIYLLRLAVNNSVPYANNDPHCGVDETRPKETRRYLPTELAVHEILIQYGDKYGALINRRITSGGYSIVLYKIEIVPPTQLTPKKCDTTNRTQLERSRN
jgi:hypothetical protein